MSNPLNLESLTLTEARAAVMEGRISAVALAEAHYDRIAAVDPPAAGGIHSYLALTRDRAFAQAARVDAAVKAGGAPILGPLAGVPIAIKDVLVMRDEPTTAGSRILENYRPPYDATAICKLEAAGAVLLGKTNCDEFAMGSSNENSAFGPVLNPRAIGSGVDRVPGGSSGGSAAAVAAGLCVASLGTDTGGSIRQPAAFCGVVGVLPTYGRVSRYGLIAFASSLDHVGPFARSVEDAAIMLEVLAGADPMDATASIQPVTSYRSELAQPAAGLRIGVPEEYFGAGLDPEIRSAIERSLDDLRAAGCSIHKVSLPHTRYAVPTYYVIATAEASANLSRFDGVRFGLRAAPAAQADPAAKTLSAMYRDTRDQGFGPEVKRRILLGTYVLSHGYYDAYYRKAQQVRTLLTRDFLAAFAQVDAIVCPVTPTPAFRLGEKTGDPLQMYLEDIYSVAASLAGICGMSVPCGATQAGLPIGVQVLGPHFGEATMLRVGAAIEMCAPRLPPLDKIGTNKRQAVEDRGSR